MEFKGQDVLTQIRKQKPDPQSEANLSTKNKLIRQLKAEETVVWNTNKPEGVSLKKWSSERIPLYESRS